MQQKAEIEYNDNGFILSSTSKSARVLYYNDVKKEIDSWSKKSGFDLKKKSEKASRMIIAYKDIKDKESIVYIVRIIKRKDQKIEI